MTSTPRASRRPGLAEALAAWPKVLVTLLLGFGSGLPFFLVGNTLGFWLRSAGWELSAIAYLSWVGFAYSLKFLWAPVVDRLDVPLLGRWLGRRRGWLVLAQLTVAAGLVGMAVVGPAAGAGLFAGFTLLAAFASATQDIVADGWRIDSAQSGTDHGLLASAFQLGYRAGLLVADSLILLAAARWGWANSYLAAAVAMAVGLAAALAAREPATVPLAVRSAPGTLAGLVDAVLGPFRTFFAAHGWRAAALMLAAISLYRLADFVIGPMMGPFYTDLGLATETVGSIRLVVGLVASLLGITLAGASAVRLGPSRTLVVGAFAGPVSNLAFTAMAAAGPSVYVFAAATVVDNAAMGFAGAALVAYMSSLTQHGYSATQYALLSSTYALLGKLLKGFSGSAVEWLGGDVRAYGLFFAGTAMIGVPAIALCLALQRQRRAATERV